jgi:hypothetical protein
VARRQNAWKCVYNLKGPSGSWLGDPTWPSAESALLKGGEAAMWGEGINKDNFDAFVWRAATAAAERLWATEQSLGCPDTVCPGITGQRPAAYWLHDNPARLADQLCRMSSRGIRTGPIDPGFCPSDADTGTPTIEDELQRLEAENAALRVQLRRAQPL